MFVLGLVVGLVIFVGGMVAGAFVRAKTGWPF
jgi:hypothetical protein